MPDQKAITVAIRNESSQDVTVTDMYLTWGPASERLTSIRLPLGNLVWTGDSTSPLSADITDTTIAGSSLALMILRFQNPAAQVTGLVTVTFNTDQGACTIGFGTNLPPVANDDTASTAEDTPVEIDVLANDSDPEGVLDPASVTVTGGPTSGTTAVNPSTGAVTYTPNPEFNGSDSFTYTVQDVVGAVSNTATVTITITPVNDAPVAVDDSYSVAEDGTLSVGVPGVLGNDSDVDGDALSAVLAGDVSHGALALGADGSFTYTPAPNFNGTDSFTYYAFDGTANSNLATVTITVNSVNDAPVAADDSYTTNEDSALSVPAPGVLGNDSDTDGDPLAAVLVDDVSHGTLALNADGSFTYTPAANYNGPDSFTYLANDGAANSNLATVTITVNSINDAPVAADDGYTVAEDNVLSVSAPGVLGNDSDVEGDTLTAVLVDDVSHGTLALNADGSLTYTPAANYNGTDSFTYRAFDGVLSSNLATVTIAVTPVNDAPVALDDSYSVDEDTTLNAGPPGVLGNDSDVDGDALTAVLVDDVSHGTLALNPNGSFTYTPDANYHGPDGFTYRAFDGALSSNLATVTITVNSVNDVPVAADDSYSTNEDTTLLVNLPGVLGNDSDADGDPLTAVLIANVANGTLALYPGGSFMYTPGPDFNGVDTFTYAAYDGLAYSNTATVTITVNPVNDAPVAVNDSYNVNEDTALVVGPPGVMGNDSDIEGDALSALLVDVVLHGALALNPDGSFTYTPAPNFYGTDSFTYRAFDGALNSNLAVVTITVLAVNDAPVAADDSYSVDEDAVLTIAVPGVLANDSDVEGDALTAVLVGDISNGALALNPDGSFTYTPAPNFYGTDSFTYRAFDGTDNSNLATVTITVNPVNDMPVAVDDSYTVDEDTTLTVAAPGILGNDIDVDGDALTAVLVGDVAHGALALNADGSFIYTPAPNYHGSDSFTYRAFDGVFESDLATVTITVNPVNDAPVAANDSYTTDEDSALTAAAPGVLGNDSDVDGDTLTAVLVGDVANGALALNADGSFTYTPAPNFYGTDSFTYRAFDGTDNSNLATVTITVNPVNDAPVAADDSYTVDEDTTLTVAAPGILDNDSDIDGDALSPVLVSDVSHGTLTLSAAGSFIYTPAPNFNGVDSFTYRAFDGDLTSNLATVTITVSPVNDAPVAADDSYSVNEDLVLTVAAPGVLGNDSDIDGDALTAVLVGDASNGTLALSADGSFTYTPDPDFNGADSFTYRASDGVDNSNLATVTITVNPVNDAPVAADDSYTVDEDTVLTIAAPGVLANDVDISGNPLTAVLVGDVSSGTLVLNADGSFTYTPTEDFNGTDSFTYHAFDGALNSNLAMVTITINPVNDAPKAVKDTATTAYETPVVIRVVANDYDVEGNLDPGTVRIVTPPQDGTALANTPSAGRVTYTPNTGFSGLDGFIYRVCDTDGACDTATVKITVDAPPATEETPTPPPVTDVPPTATAIPTETAQPTSTPVPTRTPRPTGTPRATGTPRPPATPVPATPLPPTAGPAATAVPGETLPPFVGSVLQITHFADRAEVEAGGTVTFTIVVRNAGPGALASIVISDVLTGEGAFTGVVMTEGLVAALPASLEWRLDTLGMGAEQRIQVIVSVHGAGILTACATASAAGVEPPTACASVTVIESSAGEEPAVRPTPTPLPQIESPLLPEGPLTPGEAEAPLDVRLRGSQCLEVLGVTLTCLPVVRWLLLLVGLLAVGLVFFLLRRRTEEEDEAAAPPSP